MTDEAASDGRGAAVLDSRWPHLERLLEALVDASSSLAVANAVAEAATQGLGASGCLVALLDEDGGALDVTVAVGYPPEFLETWRRVELTSDLVIAEVARNRRPVLMPPAGSDGARADVPVALRWFLAVPMLTATRLVGALAFGFQTPPDAADEVERVAVAVARQAALALDRMRLLEAERIAVEAETVARERLAFLADASALLADSLEVDATLESLAELVVPRLADWCAIHMPGEGGRAELVTVHHRDPDGMADVSAALRDWELDPDLPYGAPAALRTGTTQLFPTVPDPVLERLAEGDPERLALLRRLPVASGIVVPLTGRRGPVAALTLVREHGEPYTRAQLALAEDLGRRAGLAVDNALAYSLASDALAERDEAAAAAERERARLAAILEQVPVGVVVAEAPSGRVLLRNAAIDAIWGTGSFGRYESVSDYDRPQAATPGGELIGPEDWPLARAVRDGEVVQGEQLELRWPDGRRTSVEINAGPVRDPAGRIRAAVATLTDVSERVADDRMLARSMARAAELAHSLQASLLPPDLPPIPGVELAAAYQAVGEGLEVGGDFYDVSPSGREDEWAVAIGDVCGKGVEAAAVTSFARYTLRAAAMRARRPTVILSALNEAMLRHETDRPFITAVYAVLHPAGEAGLAVTLAVGGHPLPFVLRADGQVETVGEPGTLVGILPEAEFPETTAQLGPGDALVLYTDGVTEARRGSQLFGEGRLAKALAAHAGQDAASVVRGVEDAVSAFRSGRARDDLAVLVVRALPHARNRRG